MLDNGNDKKIKFELHLKPSTNSLYGTVRIYILWDDVREKVIVGWIGRHLYLPPKTLNFSNSQPLKYIGGVNHVKQKTNPRLYRRRRYWLSI
jgi:hypothetical protein